MDSPRRSLLMMAILVIASLSMLAAFPIQDRRLAIQAERRVALVVGNDSYLAAPLKNARNDARAIAAALRAVGFSVTEVADARRADFGAALDTFGRGLTDRDVALFYYAGHGIQIEGENFLVPIDFGGQTEASARWDTIPVARVTEALRRTRVSMIVLDACRNNPFAGSRSGGGGLAAMEGRGSLIAFAAGAGQTAGDAPSASNGLFTAHLLTTLRTPGLGVREVFRRTRELVVKATGGSQFPAVYDGLVGDFVFRAGDTTATVPDVRPAPGASAEDLARMEELAAWQSIGQTQDQGTLKSMIEEYLRLYPNGRFSGLARARLVETLAAIVKASVSGTIKLRSDQLPSATVPDLESDCRAGHWAACSVAASRYRDGAGVEKNLLRSLDLAIRGCDGGNGSACNTAGVAYLTGLVVAKDPVKAFRFYERACDYGTLVGCSNLGSRFQIGDGVAKDEARAIALFRSACAGGGLNGCNALASSYRHGRGVAQDDAQAMAFYQQACDAGNMTGCSNWGLMFGELQPGSPGRIPDPSFLGKMMTFEASCEKNVLPACGALAQVLELSTTAKDIPRALALYQRACDQNDSNSCYRLGLIFESGRHVAKDLSRAIELQRKACEANNFIACETQKRLLGQR